MKPWMFLVWVFFLLSYFNYLMKGNVIHNQNQYSTFVVYKLLHIVAIQIQGRVVLSPLPFHSSLPHCQVFAPTSSSSPSCPCSLCFTGMRRESEEWKWANSVHWDKDSLIVKARSAVISKAKQGIHPLFMAGRWPPGKLGTSCATWEDKQHNSKWPSPSFYLVHLLLLRTSYSPDHPVVSWDQLSPFWPLPVPFASPVCSLAGWGRGRNGLGSVQVLLRKR